MNPEIAVNHLTFYFDAVADDIDGKGWCVEFSDSSSTIRFETFLQATFYAQQFTPWLLGTNKEKEQ